VVNKALWTWADVQKYEFCMISDLQWWGPQFNATQKAEAAAVKTNAPAIKFLAHLRSDLWWFFDEAGLEDAALEWGQFTAQPTAAMGEVLDNAPAWSVAQAQIEGAGYVQDARHATLTTNGTLLTSPYEITLDAGGSAWHCRNNVMKVNDDAWLDLLTDHQVALRAAIGNVDGWYVNPPKLQLYGTGKRVSKQLHEWLAGTGSPGWDLATNTGGSNGPWPAVGEAYDDRNSVSNLVDVIEGSKKVVDLLRAKDPTAIICYSPVYLTVDSWRNPVYRAQFQSSYIAKYGGTVADADDYWADLITQTATTAGHVEFPIEDSALDFSAAWADNLRENVGVWIERPPKPQNIAVLP
jgi:hypothetical protein